MNEGLGLILAWSFFFKENKNIYEHKSKSLTMILALINRTLVLEGFIDFVNIFFKKFDF